MSYIDNNRNSYNTIAQQYMDNVVVYGHGQQERVEKILSFCETNKLNVSLFLSHQKKSDDSMDDEICNMLDKYGCEKLEESMDSNFRIVRNYSMRGINVEYDKCAFELGKFNRFDKPMCSNCIHQCIEGPYAIRMLPNGDLKPCLSRYDNIISFQQIKEMLR